MKKKYDDQTIMPWGKHKGKHLKDVPAGYLLHIYEGLNKGPLRDYIEENMDVIAKQSIEENPFKK